MSGSFFGKQVKHFVYSRKEGITLNLTEAALYAKERVNERPDTKGRLAGRLAVVTGGAQGFGLGIARQLIAEGATVVLADLNEAQAKEAAKEFDGRAFGLPVDVSDAASCENMVAQAVEAMGGIDLFISNAGVLKAGGLDELTPEQFAFVTKVDYTGYFNCVRAVAPVMRAQHEAAPEKWFDIVQINSKSGIVGSKKNFAYAGAKFGGVGLTQSFALELVDYGIKVNSVCPGNYYDGPLWSDPERGLFVQYLHAGKVPGAKTVEEVKEYYLSKSPIRRGCTPEDVAKAVFYCVEQCFETGQAIPVTGGQVMLG